MIHYFTLDGKTSRSFGLYISGSGAFNAPERAVETLEVPGRNGNLIVDQGRFKNVTQSYKAFIPKDFAVNAEAVRAWLLSKTSYRRLEDTYNPDVYRMARFAGPISWNVRALCAGGEAELLFDCKPQRFLKSGESKLTITQQTMLQNPTSFPALPLLTVYGSGAGSVQIGDQSIAISSISDHVLIDCELQDAYKGSENKNGTISLSEFPSLDPGTTEISFSGGVTKIDLIPRWWTL